MNFHVNKEELSRRVINHTLFIEQCPKAEFDHMPVQVATEMLCAPKARMTNRERKECQRARETRYSSQRERKPLEAKLERKFSESSFCQLVRWNRRARDRREQAQHDFERLDRQLKKLAALEKLSPVQQYAKLLGERRQAELNIAAAHFDTVRDFTEKELHERRKERV